jgi:MoaA/NifB/PqqE/SkfB family radical SAM enzyme
MKVEKPVRTLYNILFRGAPIEAQLIVTRRCNLSCGYCFEYDNSSAPVPLEDLCRWIDVLHRFKVVHITLLGGEPLMHPQVADIVAYGRRHSTVSITTNGFLVSDQMIEKLNGAKLSHMQISLDTSKPDSTNYIQKSLKVLRPKLLRLKKLARFDLHLAAVLCEHSKDEIKSLLADAKELGIPMSLSVVHKENGGVAISGEPYLQLYEYYGKHSNQFGFSMVDFEYSSALLQGKRPSWRCRAGARSLYVDEFGNVQLCASQRGRLNKPIEQYAWNDIRTQSRTTKGCESGCAVDCVFRASQVDNDKMALLKTLMGRFNGNSNEKV